MESLTLLVEELTPGCFRMHGKKDKKKHLDNLVGVPAQTRRVEPLWISWNYRVLLNLVFH